MRQRDHESEREWHERQCLKNERHDNTINLQLHKPAPLFVKQIDRFIAYSTSLLYFKTDGFNRFCLSSINFLY